MRTAIIAIPLLLATGSALAGPFECGSTAPRRAAVSAAGATRIVVIGKAGSLKVKGEAGQAQVLANGTACSSDEDFLKEVRLDIRRNGTEIVVEAVIPERVAIFNWTDAHLDFEVRLPSNLPVSVRDGSGSLEITSVASVDVVDGSGEVEIRGVAGNVDVHDGSGSVSIADVGGDVAIKDGSGGIDVTDVRGNFTVSRDGSGGVDYARVAGRVSIPRD